MTANRHASLPVSLPPLGVNRDQAAALIGVSVFLFDRAVENGSMPQPRELGGRLIWDVNEVTNAFREIPHRGQASAAPGLDANAGSGNPWDDA